MSKALSLEENVGGSHEMTTMNESTSVEVALHELGDTARSVEVINGGIGEAVDHLNALTKMSEALDPNSLMTEPAMEALQVAVRAMVTRLGGNKYSVSMENYSGLPARQAQIAVESLQETIQRIWQRILQSFKSAWEWFTKFMDKLFGTVQALERRCEALDKELKTCVDLPLHGQITTNEGLRKFTQHHTKPDEIVGAYAKQLQLLIQVQRGSLGYMQEAAKALKELLIAYNQYGDANPDAQVVKFQAVFNERVVPIFYDSNIYKAFPGAKEVHDDKAERGIDLWVVPFELGNAHFYGKVLHEGMPVEKQAEAMKHCGFGVQNNDTQAMAPSVELLSLDNCKKVLYLVHQRVKDIAAARAETQVMSEVFKELLKSSKITAGHEEMKPVIMNAITSSTHLLMKMTTVGERTIREFEVRSAKKMLDYVALSAAKLKPTH